MKFFLFKKGPPDAVNIIFLIVLTLLFLINWNIEKCSESTGIKVVLFFESSLRIRFQPQIIDSLFAIAILFVNLITLSVGINPSIPDIALIV